MTVDMHTATAALSPVGVTLDWKSLSLTLDEAWSPYAKAELVCSMPDASARDLIDLRDTDLYLTLEIRQDFGAPFSLAMITAEFGGSAAALTAFLGGQPISKLTNHYYKPWNGSAVRAARRRNARLLVIEREFDEVAQELRLVASSLEALLLGDALVSTAAIDPVSTSIRAICQQVLARYGLILDPTSLDAVVAETAATIWQPGVGAWSYLDSMLEAASLRLWCDELGTFRITARQSVSPGALTLTPTGTMTSLSDTMTRDPETWYDAVVVEYRWVDEFDLNQVAYDVAGGQPAKAVRREERPQVRYPGPGTAAGILSRGQGRGRVLDVEAVSDYTATPGMPTTITPPETDAQTGYLSAVTWRLPDAEMDVSTRGLVDTPNTAWLFVPVGKKWTDAPVGLKWTNYVPGGF